MGAVGIVNRKSLRDLIALDTGSYQNKAGILTCRQTYNLSSSSDCVKLIRRSKIKKRLVQNPRCAKKVCRVGIARAIETSSRIGCSVVIDAVEIEIGRQIHLRARAS